MWISYLFFNESSTGGSTVRSTDVSWQGLQLLQLALLTAQAWLLSHDSPGLQSQRLPPQAALAQSHQSDKRPLVQSSQEESLVPNKAAVWLGLLPLETKSRGKIQSWGNTWKLQNVQIMSFPRKWKKNKTQEWLVWLCWPSCGCTDLCAT